MTGWARGTSPRPPRDDDGGISTPLTGAGGDGRGPTPPTGPDEHARGPRPPTGPDEHARGPTPTAGPGADHYGTIASLHDAIASCRRCPRLVEWRERTAAEKRAAFRDEPYWGRPIRGYGDPAARIVVLGLAPAAHGGNRTGRIFTGDRSGDFLFAGLHRAGLANQPTSVRIGDGLRLRDCFVTAAVRCAPPANRPTPAERDTCSSWLEAEFALLPAARVILCLGAFAWDAGVRLRQALGDPIGRPRPRFGHGAVASGRWPLLGCFHPSQQNTFTGRLTPAMLDEVLASAKQLAGDAPGPPG